MSYEVISALLGSEVISALLGSVVGGTIGILGSVLPVHINKKNKLKANCFKIAFLLAMQKSELGNFLKQINTRLERLKLIEIEHKNMIRENIISIVEDFILIENINVNVQEAAEILLQNSDKRRGIVEVMQSIFLCDKYFVILTQQLKKYNDMKKTMLVEVNSVEELLHFTETNFPVYKENAERFLNFTSQTFNAFSTEVKANFNIDVKFNISNDLVRLI